MHYPLPLSFSLLLLFFFSRVSIQLSPPPFISRRLRSFLQEFVSPASLHSPPRLRNYPFRIPRTNSDLEWKRDSSMNRGIKILFDIGFFSSRCSIVRDSLWRDVFFKKVEKVMFNRIWGGDRVFKFIPLRIN